MSSTDVNVRSLVQPWRETFLRLAVRPEPDRFSDSTNPGVWLEWRFPHDDPASLTRSIEALELYVLLERVDNTAWSEEIQTICAAMPRGYACRWGRCVFEKRPFPRVRGHKLTIRPFDDVRHFSEYLSAEETADDAFSPAYLYARAILEHLCPETAAKPVIAMCLNVEPSLSQLQRVWELLPFVLALAAMPASMRPDCRLAKMRSRFEYWANPTSIFSPADEDALSLYLQLHRLGITSYSFPEVKINVASATIVPTLKELCGSQCGSVSGSVRDVNLSPLSPVGEAVASAITDATSIMHLSVSFHRLDDPGVSVEDRQRALRWTAFALFSRHTTTTAKKVTIQCHSLTIDHVTVMAELLCADEPLTLLYEDLAESILAHRLTRVSATRFVLSDPTIAVEAQSIVEISQHENLRVLGVVADWWIVLLPGWGRAWVHAVDATVSTISAQQDPAPRFGVREVECLELSSLRDFGAFAALLHVVGSHVLKLKLEDVSLNMEDWCTGVVETCPDLEELVVSGSESSRLMTIAECITRRSSDTKIERLVIMVQYFSRENLSDLQAMLTMLADRQHPLARQLRGFAVYAGGPHAPNGMDDVWVGDCSLLEHALAMLDTNKTLEYLRLDLPLESTWDEARIAVIQAAVNAQQHQQLPVSANQIAVRAKAAFLSVVRSDSSAVSTAAMRALDRGVLSTIFDFAPKPRYRCVHVVVPRVRRIGED